MDSGPKFILIALFAWLALMGTVVLAGWIASVR